MRDPSAGGRSFERRFDHLGDGLEARRVGHAGAIDEHRWSAGDLHLFAELEVGVDGGRELVLVERLLEHGHVETGLLGLLFEPRPVELALVLEEAIVKFTAGK